MYIVQSDALVIVMAEYDGFCSGSGPDAHMDGNRLHTHRWMTTTCEADSCAEY